MDQLTTIKRTKAQTTGFISVSQTSGLLKTDLKHYQNSLLSTLSNYSHFACRTLKCEIHLAIIQNEWLLLGTTIITDKISTGYHAEKWSTATSPEMDKWAHIKILCEAQLFIHALTWATVYPKKYARGFCFAVLCCGYTLTDFPISIRLTSLALWQSNDCPSASKATLMNMDKCFMWIHYERLHNHNKAKHNRTVCIFLGIYCKPPLELDWCWFSWSLTLQQQRPLK